MNRHFRQPCRKLYRIEVAGHLRKPGIHTAVCIPEMVGLILPHQPRIKLHIPEFRPIGGGRRIKILYMT